MKKLTLFHYLMIGSVVIQSVLGLALTIIGLYGEIELYTQIDCFFLHFMFVPGVVLLLSLLHFLVFKRYEKKYEFPKTGAFMALCVCFTGQILVILYDLVPTTWPVMLFWYILASVLTAALVFGLNMMFALGFIALEKTNEEAN